MLTDSTPHEYRQEQSFMNRSPAVQHRVGSPGPEKALETLSPERGALEKLGFTNRSEGEISFCLGELHGNHTELKPGIGSLAWASGASRMGCCHSLHTAMKLHITIRTRSSLTNNPRKPLWAQPCWRYFSGKGNCLKT